MGESKLGPRSEPSSVLGIPSSSAICELWVIDTTTLICAASSALITPEIKGHELLNLPTFAFYIHNKKANKRVLFDNGARKDWWNLPPHVVDAIVNTVNTGLTVEKNTSEILAEGGVDPATIDAVIWSHFHYDHIGSVGLFPSSTDLVVGPGFEEFAPGYPAKLTSPILQEDLDGRRVQEVKFDGGDKDLRIGSFNAHDFFGDGSFYLLHTPGHTAGHLSGLVRTSPNAFAFLGGDISHFAGMFRPTQELPMPRTLPSGIKLDARHQLPCPCSHFTACHPNRGEDDEIARHSPYYGVSQHTPSWHNDPVAAQQSVDGLKILDALDNIFVALAHDPALYEVEHFPRASLNNWETRNLKQQLHWHFLTELPVEGKAGLPALVEGFPRDT